MILQEECSAGQRIRAYRLEARAQGSWRTLGRGTAIGHKRIQPVTSIVAEAVRFVALESVGQGTIRRLAAFNTGSAPPSTWDAPPHIWADDAVGEWTHGSFSVDLSEKITAAGQYRLRFVAEDGAKVVGQESAVAARRRGAAQPGASISGIFGYADPHDARHRPKGDSCRTGARRRPRDLTPTPDLTDMRNAKYGRGSLLAPS